jgi:type IV pilus assembly protein PilO
MNERLEELMDRPLRVKLAVLLGSILFVVGAYWYFLYSGTSSELLSLTEAIEGAQGLRTRIAQREGIARNLDKFLSEVEKLDTELKKALAELPDEREIAQLLERVSDKARDAGLEIRTFRPRPEQKKDFYAEVPVEIEISGTFHQVATFFDEVGNLERIVNIDQFDMGGAVVEEDRVTLKSSLTATSFRFLEESERPRTEKESSDRRRRRKR